MIIKTREEIEDIKNKALVLSKKEKRIIKKDLFGKKKNKYIVITEDLNIKIFVDLPRYGQASPSETFYKGFYNYQNEITNKFLRSICPDGDIYGDYYNCGYSGHDLLIEDMTNNLLKNEIIFKEILNN